MGYETELVAPDRTSHDGQWLNFNSKVSIAKRNQPGQHGEEWFSKVVFILWASKPQTGTLLTRDQ